MKGWGGADQLADISMDSIVTSVAVWGISVKLCWCQYGKSALRSALLSLSHSTQTLSGWGCPIPFWGSWNECEKRWRWAKSSCVKIQRGGMKVIHSDPAATIKIGGVRCLHSSLCKSHHPETFILTLRGWLHHHQISRNQALGDENMVFKTKTPFFVFVFWYSCIKPRDEAEWEAHVNVAVLELYARAHIVWSETLWKDSGQFWFYLLRSTAWMTSR